MTSDLKTSEPDRASRATLPPSGEMARVPVATYRLQFNRLFRFDDARRRVAYLHTLGISDCYASPYLKARAESTHGYDIADHNALNPAIGDETGYRAFVAELHAHGMGQMLDIVPNHMGIGESSNTWWMDVLENGPSSLYAPFFDIDWHPVKAEVENKVLLPILGQQYGRVLENGELALRYEDGAFFLNYYQTELPINPRTYTEILSFSLDQLIAALGPEDDHVLEYLSIMTALSHLPPRTETERAKVIERRREKEIIKRRLAVLYATSPEVRVAIKEAVRRFNGAPGDPRSFDLLDALIDRQAYRPSYWRVAAEEINYRRFFDINDLAAIRMERPEVFEATHRLIMRLLAEGAVTGLRIDHPDGLWDPGDYFRRLQQRYAQLLAETRAQPPAGRQSDCLLYIVAEKILGGGERLPTDWALHGTSGYDFLRSLNGLFVDSSAEKRFDEIYTSFIGSRLRFDDLVYDSKKQIMRIALASELNVLAHQLNRISERNRYYRDFTLNSLRDAIREVIACFPVYRTYITAETEEVTERDRAYIESAIARAKRRNPTVEPSIFDFLGDILLLRYPNTIEQAARDEQRTFVMKFQQTTGPVMAKGLEDTTFYIYNRLVSLNEVGGEPQRFGTTPAAFHRHNQERLRHWPASMLTTSTHDTKRSEDVRARINVLSELPQEWRAALTRWSRLNRRKKISVDDRLAPSRNEEYLLYQTLLGAWPFELSIEWPGPAERPVEMPAGRKSERGRRAQAAPPPTPSTPGWPEFIERIQNYMIKAIREAKVNTSWLNPNTAYDDAVRSFVAAILADTPENEFLADFLALQRKVAYFGVFNSLAQTLLKLTVPGVPDIYQGNELWDFSLVDPDNRRPVDFDLRERLLDELRQHAGDRAALARSLIESREDGRIKLYLTYRALTYRRDHARLFQEGSYTPLDAGGDAAEHIVAFARSQGDEQALVVAPRLLAKRLRGAMQPPLGAHVWGAALLIVPGASAGQRYRNIFTGEVLAIEARGDSLGLPLAGVFANFPVALFERIATPAQPAARATTITSSTRSH